MKHMKQALALLLTLVLALALTVPALAATATWEKMAEGNSVLAPESAYTPASVQAALTAYQHFLDAKTGSQAEKDAYNNEFKPAILALEFKPHTFSDAPSDWYDKALNFVFSTGRMNGVGNNLFDPQGTMTRAMAVTILWRMNGEPAPKAASGFSDVPANEWYAKAVAWAVENKITTGKSATIFDPNAPVTREQMATFFSRMIIALAGYGGDLNPDEAAMRRELAKQYSDAAQIDGYALKHVLICLQTGVMKGNAGGTFAPLAPITRAQGAQMLLNYYNFLLKETFRKF